MVEEARIPNYEYANSVEPLTLTAAWAEDGPRGFLGPTKARIPVRLEAYVCAACGYSELHAKDLATLERFAREGLGGVRRIGPR